MISNAYITRIDVPAAADAAGVRTWTTGAAIWVGCNLQAATSREKFAAGAVIKDADAKVYVSKAITLGAGYRVIVDAALYEVLYVEDWKHGSQSHYLAFVKRI